VRLTEVEAYGGKDDPASHAFGSRTNRNEPMYGPAGTLYVYLSYGVHWCANVVVGPAGTPNAVLMRGGEVVEGRRTAERRRGRATDLSNGPGRLGQALGLNGSHSGLDLFSGPIRLEGPFGSVTTWSATPRIGISKAIDTPWRFIEAEESS
jgi:DNA-3-methyladenine glycosylase